MPALASGPKRTDNGPQLPYSMANIRNVVPSKLSGLILWLDATDSTTITLSNDGTVNRVISWRDKSASSSVLNLPSLYSNGPGAAFAYPFQSNTTTTMNTLFFSTAVTAIRSSNLICGNMGSFFIVAPELTRLPGGTGNISAVTILGGQNGNTFTGGVSNFNSTGGTIGASIGKFRNFNLASNTAFSGEAALTDLNCYTQSNSSLLIWCPNLNLGGGNSFFNGIGFDRTVNNWGFNGHIGEIVAYSRALNNVEESQVVSYLTQKWSFQSNVPGEPLYNQPLYNPTAIPKFFNTTTVFSNIMSFRFPTYTLPISNVQFWFDAMDTSVFTDINSRSPPTPNNPIGLNSWSNKGVLGSTVTARTTTNFPTPIFNIFGTNRYPEVNTIQGNFSYLTDLNNTGTGRYSYTNGKNMTCFIVFRVYGTGAVTIFALHTGSSYDRAFNGQFFGVIANNTQFGYSSGLNPMFATTIITNTTYVGTIIINCNTTSTGGALPSNGIVNINGAYATNSSNIGLSNYSIDKVGLFGYFNDGTSQRNQGLNEIVCCYRAVTTQERVAMENQLLAKWGIARNQPVSYLATSVPVTSGLTMWYDAYLPAFVTTNSSNQVTSWLDRSGNGYHMSNGTFSSNLPVYSTITGQTRSLPSVFFQYTSSNNYSYLQNFNLQSNTYNNFSVIYAGYFTKPRVTGEPRVVSFISTINAGDDFIFGEVLDSLNPDRSPGQNINYTNLNLSNFVIKSSFLNLSSNTQGAIPASNNTTYVNGSNITSNIVTVNPGNWVPKFVQLMGASLANAPQFGGDRAAAGYLNEVLIYNRCLALSEITSVHTYLLNKWNIRNPVAANVPVTSGLTLWLDAYDSAQVIRDSAGAVWLWRDKSGCNFHFSNTNTSFPTEAVRPTYSATAVGGLPGLLFFSDSGTVGGTACNRTSLKCLNISYPSTCNLSAFVVFQQRSNVRGDGNLITFTSNTDGVDYNFTNGVTISARGDRSGVNIQRSNSIPFISGTNTGTILTTVIFNGSSTTIPDITLGNVGGGRNGVISVNSSNGSVAANFSFNNGWIGTRNGGGDSTTFYDGYACEYLIYNRTVTFNERQQIESYLLNKWNI